MTKVRVPPAYSLFEYLSISEHRDILWFYIPVIPRGEDTSASYLVFEAGSSYDEIMEIEV